MSINPGALVRYREREWVVLPSEDPELIRLRPMGGSAREATAVLRSLSERLGYTLPYERVEAATFPLPDPTTVQDQAAVRLLMDAARLLLRDGAAPFRALGHLSVRPRPYQFVPLLMALRQEVVRLLIADDVGIGKTVEAGLIARELLDRGLVQRVAVLCPPYLCDQWQKELQEKFHIRAEVIRSGTIARLERQTPPNRSLFAHLPHLVASIDTVKSERYRAAFVQHCPELVIVDEVHGAAAATGRSPGQQQRHRLLLQLAENARRHLLLLSATPHSGKEESFLSLLGLLRADFADLDLNRLSQEERAELARHFVQRRRPDVAHWMGADTPFPERESEGAEQAYTFSAPYRRFYNAVYDFAQGLVRSAESLAGWQRRMRFWSALALLRCVSSSPAAAEAALRKRLAGGDESGERALLEEPAVYDLDAEFSLLVYDDGEGEAALDAPPSGVFDAQEQDPSWGEGDRRRLRDLARSAANLRGRDDAKLEKLTALVDEMLAGGFQPIVWCRFIATADYVAGELAQRLGRKYRALGVTAVTGALSDDERRLKVAELAQAEQRVLVATDCLSEGVNLQEHFNAVLHYDLPWNPNRLEQREGRVDRFGQSSPTVKAVLLFGQDNPVDGAVLDVLLRKARDIYRQLGVRVPLPQDSESVMEAVLHSLFERAGAMDAYQPSLFEQYDPTSQMVRRVHEEWTASAEREKESRTRFAQRAIRPEEVEQELRESDRVLGSAETAAAFLQNASQRLGFGLERRGRRAGLGAEVWHLDPRPLPGPVRMHLGDLPAPLPITFDSPTPAGLHYIGRNHPLVEGLAEHLVDLAFHPEGDYPPVARCGVIRTDQVERRTALFLLRLRFTVREWGAEQRSLAEETVVWGQAGVYPHLTRLDAATAQRLLDEARPTANLSHGHKVEVLTETLDWWDHLQDGLETLLLERAEALQESHRRVRKMAGQRTAYVDPQENPDLLGLLVLLPEV